MKSLFSLHQKQTMKRLFLFVFIVLFSTSVFSQKQKLKKGAWISEMQLSESDILPFNLLIHKEKRKYKFTVVNGSEEIVLDDLEFKNDSLHAHFPYFNSELKFSIKNKKRFSGYWYNYNKGVNYKIPFTAFRSKSQRFRAVTKNQESVDFDGRWEVTFEPYTTSSYPAVGIFKQQGNSLEGTYLTETGDYRFLDGNATNDSLYLSCFDGSHAFLFKAGYTNDTLHGEFLSGNHWQCEWNAKRNDTITLRSPEELTYVKEDNEFKFELKDIDGNTFSFPSEDYQGKVTIIQIMGTWCPNCLDETQYYRELYKQHHDKGLEIIAIGYETGDSFDDYANNLKRLKDKLGLDYKLIVGGEASKSLASEHFYMLNEVISFPTTIFIGRDGKVKRVHTGFNGPGTGHYYTEYTQKTNALIESLLAQ